jgi:hypothetical protein
VLQIARARLNGRHSPHHRPLRAHDAPVAASDRADAQAEKKRAADAAGEGDRPSHTCLPPASVCATLR